MPLPSRWVDSLFAKLTVTYGQDFLRRWEGVPMDTVKADWAEALGGYEKNPEAIAFALTILDPAKPPTVLQFAEMCRRAPQTPLPALEAPAPSPEAVRMATAALKRVGAQSVGDKSWAERLRDREARSNGKGMTKFQRDAWREALNLPPNVAAKDAGGNA
jgi:hypothetical protein